MVQDSVNYLTKQKCKNKTTTKTHLLIKKHEIKCLKARPNNMYKHEKLYFGMTA